MDRADIRPPRRAPCVHLSRSRVSLDARALYRCRAEVLLSSVVHQSCTTRTRALWRVSWPVHRPRTKSTRAVVLFPLFPRPSCASGMARRSRAHGCDHCTRLVRLCGQPHTGPPIPHRNARSLVHCGADGRLGTYSLHGATNRRNRRNHKLSHRFREWCVRRSTQSDGDGNGQSRC